MDDITHKSFPLRFILDPSFVINPMGTKQPPVNVSTTKLAPQEFMNKIRRLLPRIIPTMEEYYMDTGSWYFSKYYIKYGYWQLRVAPEYAWNFTYVLTKSPPKKNINETEIVVPGSIQMGWSESPPYFCAASETAR